MCARINQQLSGADLTRYFDPINGLISEQLKFNLAPTQTIAAITETSPRLLEHYRWGLIPSWAKDLSIGRHMFNARSETAASKPSFRAAFRRRRCVVPVAGFFEWTGPTGARQPLYIYRTDGHPMALAGLWERNEALDVISCTILTTSPNQMMSRIHNRMPVVLEHDRLDEWLDSGNSDTDALQSMLVAPPEETLTYHPVHPRMGNARINDPSIIKRLIDFEEWLAGKPS